MEVLEICLSAIIINDDMGRREPFGKNDER